MGESQVFGPEVLKDAERQVQMSRENLKIAQSHQKSYIDKWRRDLSFNVGNFVYLKLSPMRGTKRFKVKGKLAPRYAGLSKFWIAREKWLINLSYHHSYQMYTTCLCVPAQEVFMSFRRADTDGTAWSRRRSIIQREANQNFGYRRTSDSQ
jgi:hypothetical protein